MANMDVFGKKHFGGCMSDKRQANGLSVVSRIANQHGNGNVVAARAEGACDETERDNGNCTLENNLQQASISGTQSDKAPVYDSDGSAEVSSVEQGGGTVEQHPVNIEETRVLYDSLYNNLAIKVEKVNSVNHKMKETNAELTTELKTLELEIERLLRAVVSRDIMSVVQHNSVVDTSNLQTELEHTKERFENCIIKKENEYAKLWNDWYKKCEECKYDKILYDKAYNDMQQKIERLQAQLGDQKGKSKDTPCDSEQNDTTRGMSANTKFAKQLILGKPPYSSRPKLYDVTPIPKSKEIPKIDKSHALSKPVTSNSVPTLTESKVVKNINVISLGIFRINHFKAFRVDNFMPNKHVKASVRTKLIIVSQPHVITKNDVNSKTNGFSPKDVKNTTRTRRPLSRNNPKSDKNTKSKVACAMCKQCLITVNHDVYVLNYVNDMNSRDPEEELEVEAEDDVPPPATPSVGSPITPPPLFESSSNTEDVALIVANEALEMPPTGSTYEVGGPSSVSLFPPFYLHGREIARLDDNTELLLSNVKNLEQCEKKRKAEMEANSSEISKVKKCMNEIGRDLGDEMQFSNLVKNRKKVFYNLQAWVLERFRRGAMDARPDDGVDGSAAFGESKPPKPPESPSSSQIMPPKMMKRKAVKKMVKKWIAEAIEEYEKTKSNLDNAESSRGNTGNVGGTMNVQGCSHKTFMNRKPHSFNGTEGVVGLRHWIEKIKQVFEIFNCAEEDKVMFAASTFEGRALTWWNGNVHTLGLDGGRTLDLDLKGDDIEAYNNHFHELALMCPNLVPNEKKKIKRYTKGFPERIKGNITSSRPTTLHDTINLACELIEQVVQGKAVRVNESNKRKWDEHQKNHPNNNNPNNRNRNRNNNNQHHQQNMRRRIAGLDSCYGWKYFTGCDMLWVRREGAPQTQVSKEKEPAERGSSYESLRGG
nr:hypothetical protein [Tanacetum cinerariifolium]